MSVGREVTPVKGRETDGSLFGEGVDLTREPVHSCYSTLRVCVCVRASGKPRDSTRLDRRVSSLRLSLSLRYTLDCHASMSATSRERDAIFAVLRQQKANKVSPSPPSLMTLPQHPLTHTP